LKFSSLLFKKTFARLTGLPDFFAVTVPDILPFRTGVGTNVGVGVWAFIALYENTYTLAIIKHKDNAMFLNMLTSYKKTNGNIVIQHRMTLFGLLLYYTR
jgi:hypothetical protein